MKKLYLQFSEIGNDYHMRCLEQSLNAHRGVLYCTINCQTKQALICFDPLTANLSIVRQNIEAAGLSAEPIIDTIRQSI